MPSEDGPESNDMPNMSFIGDNNENDAKASPDDEIKSLNNKSKKRPNAKGSPKTKSLNNKSKKRPNAVSLSIVLNVVFFIVSITCIVLYVIKSSEISDVSSTDQNLADEDVFYMCLPCEPMTMMGKPDSEEEFKYRVNGTTMCCKKSKDPLKVPNKGDMLSLCQKGLSTGENTNPAALMYIDLDLTNTKGADGIVRWSLEVNNASSYIRGGAQYNRDQGTITIPHDGIYVIYSYIQLDTYTVHRHDRLQKMQPIYHSIITLPSKVMQLNKFMLFPDAYTNSQIGPLIISLNKGDRIMVATNGIGHFHRDPRTSLFGLYQLA